MTLVLKIPRNFETDQESMSYECLKWLIGLGSRPSGLGLSAQAPSAQRKKGK